MFSKKSRFVPSPRTTKVIAVTGATGGAIAASAPSHAALDLTAIGTSLTAAQTDALAVGALVIGVIAATVVVAMVIGMVRKL